MNFAKFKFRDRLLATLLFVCIPLILSGSIFAYYQIKNNLQVGIERQLQDSTDSLLNLIKTSAAVSIKSRLHGIAQKNLEIAHLYYQKYLSGQLTKDQAIQIIEEIYLSQTIGATGYIYCLNSNGKVMVHPNSLVKGTHLFHLDFVKALIEKKEGYLEYSYKNPDEKHARSKVISVVYFKPLDWFVCVSAYQVEFNDLIDPDDFKPAIFSFKSGESGHAYLLHEDGNVLVHPEFERGQVMGKGENSKQVSKEILEKKSGKLQYFWKNPGDPKPREKIVFFKHIPEFKWIVASSSYVDEVYAPLTRFKKMLVTFVFVGLLVLIWVAFIISKFVTNPLEKMMDTLEKGASGDYSVRMEELGSLEFITLSRHFNRFMHQLEDDTAKIEKEIHKNIESQKALVENDLMLRNLFDQSFHYVVILSPFGMVERVNQRALDLGQAPGDVLYRPFWETAWFQHDSLVSDQLKNAIEKAKKGDLVRYETTCVGNLGDIRDIDISIKPVFLPSGDAAFIIAEGRDITEYKKTAHEKKELAVQLERSRKMEAIGTLAGGIAHDFNNILSGILGYSQLAQMNLDHPSRAKSHLNQIGQGIQRAAELIQQILTFSRQTEFEKKALKLHILVKEALKLVRSSLPATIEIKETILTKEMVLADPTQMHQVIMNLCTNAYHAMIKTGGVLSVQLKSVALAQTKDVFDRKIKPDTYIELTVTDTGCGMDEHTFSKAFDPYFTTKEVGKGTGFGLALVNAIVDEHGGYIKVQTAPGKGSSFFVYLPRITAASREDNSPESAFVIKGGTEHIMVVDDEKDIRTVLQTYLKHLGYTVSVFSDGVQAFSAFESAPDDFDLIITDMTMPKMTGDIFAHKVLALQKDMPIILCTGYSETISDAQMREDQIFKTGIRKYIQKPVDTKKLSAVIRSIFDSKIEPDSQKHD